MDLVANVQALAAAVAAEIVTVRGEISSLTLQDIASAGANTAVDLGEDGSTLYSTKDGDLAGVLVGMGAGKLQLASSKEVDAYSGETRITLNPEKINLKMDGEDFLNVTPLSVTLTSGGTLMMGAIGSAVLTSGSMSSVSIDLGQTGFMAHKPAGVPTVVTAVNNSITASFVEEETTFHTDATFEGAVSVPDDSFSISKVDGLQEALDSVATPDGITVTLVPESEWPPAPDEDPLHWYVKVADV